MATQPLTADVETFLRRALPHFMAGKTVEESLRCVLADDARLITAAFKRGSASFFPTPDERGVARSTGVQVGDCIASLISQQVYAALRSPADREAA